RIGTCRSPTSNLARLAPTSPMVAMRTASAMASVETPRSAATSLIGTTRSSGRSSSAEDTTLAISGMRLAWLVISAATRLVAAARVRRGVHDLAPPPAVARREPEGGGGRRGGAAVFPLFRRLRAGFGLGGGHVVDEGGGVAPPGPPPRRPAHDATAVDEHALH